MGSIQTGIELNDEFSSVMYGIINAANLMCSTMSDVQQSMNANIDTSSLEGAREEINQAAAALDELNASAQHIDVQAPTVSQSVVDIPDQVINVDVQPNVPDPLVENPDVIPLEVQPNAPPDPVTVPVEWQADNLEVFTNTGIERFEQEVQSTNNMLNTLNQTQQTIQQTAAGIDILPDAALTDISAMGQRLQVIQQRIQEIENNPINVGSDIANTGLEQLRAQLNQAIVEQTELNEAVDNMDVEAANAAYLQLSNTISGTERYIRDNTDEQGMFNTAIQQGQQYASRLSNTIATAVAAFASIATVRKVWSFISDSMDAYDTQLNAETQLMSVLANMLDDEYVAEYALEVAVSADTSDAIDEINAVAASVEDVEITVDLRTDALQAEFDAITEKASEIQASGIYGDEAMIAGAAELSTYFTDTDAITMMMDTLADYAMGMSGGGEVDTESMVEYATNLGKIMTGAYDAMTKKGFEFTDVQEAIIEGTATQEQIVATLGEEYLDMSEDMQAAAAITQVIDESWAGLYESMSDTPQGKIIQMTNAWGDMVEVIGSELYPYVIAFVDTINNNWPTISTVIDSAVNTLQIVLGILNSLLNVLFDVVDVVSDNWSLIAPIIWGIVTALIAYHTWQLAVNVINGIAAGIHSALAAAQGVQSGATGVLTAATEGAAVAQSTLNASMYACPVTWIIILIIALAAAFVLLWDNCEGFRNFMVDMWEEQYKLTGRFYNSAVVPVVNGLISAMNVVRSTTYNFAVDMVNMFADMAINIIESFDWVVDAIKTVLNAYNAVNSFFGKDTIDVDGLVSADGINDLRDAAIGVLDASVGYDVEGISTIDLDAWDSAVDTVGDSLRDFTFSDWISVLLDDLFSIDTDDYDITADDYEAALDELLSSIDDISDDTSDISDSLDITEEDLKYLRDIAEQEAINRYTTAEITIEQTNNNTVSGDMDLDGVVSGLTDAVNEAVDIITEGVHE